MNWPSIILWGFTATTVLTIILRGTQALGFTRMDIPFLLGTMFTGDRDKAKFYGVAVHILNGWAFSLLYALLFEEAGFAAWWLGAAAGLLHSVFVLAIALPVLPGVHPRMASESAGPLPLEPLEPPGFLGLHYGRRTAVATVLAHLVFGGILGAFYRPL